MRILLDSSAYSHLKRGHCLIAQLMTIGTLDDVRWLIDQVPADALRRVLRDPPIGIFNERSWRFWHLRLDCRPIPPLPVRQSPPAT